MLHHPSILYSQNDQPLLSNIGFIWAYDEHYPSHIFHAIPFQDLSSIQSTVQGHLDRTYSTNIEIALNIRKLSQHRLLNNNVKGLTVIYSNAVLLNLGPSKA